METLSAVEELHAGLVRRPRPESVCAAILRLPQIGRLGLSDEVLGRIRLMARNAERWTFMSEEWDRPSDASKQIATFVTLLDRAGMPHTANVWRDTDPNDANRILRRAEEWCMPTPVAWMNGSPRAQARLVRFAAHLRDKAGRMGRANTKTDLAIVGRAGLVLDLTLGEFAATGPASQAFMAYQAAANGVRRQFTLHGKANAFDMISEGLLAAMHETAETNWATVARCYMGPGVVGALSDAEVGMLAGRWSAEMRRASDLVASIPGIDRIRRDRMSVFAGMDSDTWNLAAQAYNHARSRWLALIQGGAWSTLLVTGHPPKLLRLMAADLVYWHHRSGGQPDADTAVAAELPWPWEPWPSTDTVRAACEKHGVDPYRTGWLGVRPRRATAEVRATPELVHGITVTDPIIGSILRRAVVFSGGPVKGEHLDGLTVEALESSIISPRGLDT